MPGSSLLAVDNLSKCFGSLQVVDAVSFTVGAGECVGVMGPNGAGKSTLFDLIAGVTRPNSGTVEIGGRDVSALSAENRVRRGLGRAFQIPKPFASLSVFEHLMAAQFFGAGKRGAAAEKKAYEVLKLTGLGMLRNQPGGSLRLLDRKRLELAKALATEPKVLLLDEISGGLTEHEVASMVQLIVELKKGGLAILWIEHIAHALQSACDRIMLLNLGQKVIEDTPEKVSRDPEVRRLYLGETETSDA